MGSTVLLLKKYFGETEVKGLNYDARYPDKAIKLLIIQYQHYEKSLDPNNNILLMASSLGGFFAAEVCAKIGGKLVLFNPALNPFESLAKYDGETINTPDGPKIFNQQHVKSYEKYCGLDMEETFNKIKLNGFGLRLFTTDDPIINPQLSASLCTEWGNYTHFPDIKEHRLGESSVRMIKNDITHLCQS